MQKTIGLIGGMSWESTAVYYRLINEIVRDRLGGLHSADVVMRSVDFDRIVKWQKAGEWGKAADHLADIGRKLEAADAGCVLICTNTMHLVADAVADGCGIPLIHIVDVTGEALVAAGAKKPLLLATRYTMEQTFYRDRLKARYGLDAVVPDEAGRAVVHDTIFNELCCGKVVERSKQAYLDVIEKGRAAGCDSVILGCTEIGLLISANDIDLPVFDSTTLHATAAVEFALGSQPQSKVA
ncbi:aspartate/glutamate racemase family protein [Rhizobium sp. NRK18]|uniref:aspartate/glutamate racemase family protein n=1 Tax=Rhizobium sp. NRK18 TaxID=2964667 RepID=UPI0021C25B00|nr:aspartate/glutamate racemase family protein [Rhizobium sp. NRK18]MCQ2003351.1 aspartate/glutamate racemase family protein [Rhizobium sp. NRK18]